MPVLFPTSSRIRVGVLRGGPSPEYDVSLKTGATVLRHLPEKYEPRDIFISKSGEWHMDGLVRPPERILGHVDVVWNALHGDYGEDGKVQKLLDSLHKPYTGSGTLASAVGMNKLMAKNAFRSAGLKAPVHFALKRGESTRGDLHVIANSMMMPVVVKPATAGSSYGVSLAWEIGGLEDAVEAAFAHSDLVLVEECIRGREATCGVVERFRDRKLYSLLPVEIIPQTSKFFDYSEKYGGAKEVCPGNWSADESRMLQEMALKAHEAIGARHYSRSDFIVSKRGVYILEINTLPGLTEASLLPKSLEAVGCPLPHFLDHVITLALGRK